MVRPCWALSLRSGEPLLKATGSLPAGRAGVAGSSVLVPAGPFVLGVDAARSRARSTMNARRMSSTCRPSRSGGFR